MASKEKHWNGVMPAAACPSPAVIETFACREDLYEGMPGSPP